MPITDKAARIAVIGAGPSGLATAHRLRKNGFTNVMVLERLGRVGGLCYTVSVDGDQYDIGANYLTPAYKLTLELAESVGAETVFAGGIQSAIVSRDTAGKLQVHWVQPKAADLPPMSDFISYLELRETLSPILDQPAPLGLNTHPTLMVSFKQWLDTNNLSSLASIFAVPVTGMGYGFLDEIPAPHALKFLSTEMIYYYYLRTNAALLSLTKPLLHARLLKIHDRTAPWPLRFKQGFQNFWEKVAEELDVRLNSQIESITRNAGKATIKLKQLSQMHNNTAMLPRTLEVDAVVLGCPLTVDVRSNLGLDQSPQEKALFDPLDFVSYCVTGYYLDNKIANLDTQAVAIHPFNRTTMGRPWGIAQPWVTPEGAFVQCYTRVDANAPDAVVQANVDAAAREMLGAMGATVVNNELLTFDRWPYFQHANLTAIQSGYFDKLEQLQGHQNTFYVGGGTHFELVEYSIEYAQHIVDTHFPQ